MLTLVQFVLENRPVFRHNNEWGQVFVELIPLERAILPETCTKCRWNKSDDKVVQLVKVIAVPAMTAPSESNTSTLRLGIRGAGAIFLDDTDK